MAHRKLKIAVLKAHFRVGCHIRSTNHGFAIKGLEIKESASKKRSRHVWIGPIVWLLTFTWIIGMSHEPLKQWSMDEHKNIKTFLYLWENVVFKFSFGSFEVVEIKIGQWGIIFRFSSKFKVDVFYLFSSNKPLHTAWIWIWMTTRPSASSDNGFIFEKTNKLK